MILIGLLLFTGCGVRVEDLPLLQDPHVCEISALRRIDYKKDHLKRTPFPGGKVTSPFFLLVKIRDVENRGTIRIALYTKSGKRLRNVSLPFGVEGKFYQHITCFERFSRVPPGTYRIAVFVNERLRDERPLTVFPRDSG